MDVRTGYVVGAETLVRGAIVRGDPEYDDIHRTELRPEVAEAAGLFGASRGIILGVKVDDYVLASEVGEGDGVVAGVL